MRDLSKRLRQGQGVVGGWFLCGGREEENSSLHDVVTVLSGSKMTFPTRVFMCDFFQEKLNVLDSGGKKRIGVRVGEGHYGGAITPSLTLNAVKNSSTFSIAKAVAKVKEMMEVPFTVDADGLEAGDGNNCDLVMSVSPYFHFSFPFSFLCGFSFWLITHHHHHVAATILYSCSVIVADLLRLSMRTRLAEATCPNLKTTVKMIVMWQDLTRCVCSSTSMYYTQSLSF